jgi:hypothetical protein
VVDLARVAEMALGLLCSIRMGKERPAGANAPRRDYQWVILVARDQSDLYAHLRDALRGDPKVQVMLDRRDNDSRNQPWVNERLRSHGAVVIRIPESER